MAKTTEKSVRELLDEISNRLDTVEELMAWTVRADQRFHRGQRVQFSPAAERRGLTARVKGRVNRGTVIQVSDSFWVDVKLDGYKRTGHFHHSFFDPISAKVKGGEKGGVRR
jgi:hypothetical protein